MSFLSVLGGIGKSLIGLGGGSNTNKVVDGVLKGLGAVGPVAAGAAKGSSDQRLSEGQLALGYGNIARGTAQDQFSSDLARSNAMFGAGMQGAQFNREGQDRAQKNGMLSALLGGLQDFKATPGNPAVASRMGTSTGGLRPSALTGNKDALLAMLSQQQIQAPTYEAPSPYVAPALPQMPQAGAMEKILGGVGLGGSILGAIGQLGRQPSQESKGPVNGIQNPGLIRGGMQFPGSGFMDPNSMKNPDGTITLVNADTGERITLPRGETDFRRPGMVF